MQWAENTRRSYAKTVLDLQKFMDKNNIEPIMEYVDYELVSNWSQELSTKISPVSIKQKFASMSSMFSHYNNLNVIKGNPFLTIKLLGASSQNHHSRVLSLTDLFEVYKAAHELESEGVPILLPTKTAMFTGLRSTSLTKLIGKSVFREDSGLVYKFVPSKYDDSFEVDETITDSNNKTNSKNKNFFLPLPPKFMEQLKHYAQNIQDDESLLRGLKGKPLANKQMNYITDRLCDHLGWIKVEYQETKDEDRRNKQEIKTKKGDKRVKKTAKFFTPHGFRYTLATLFHEFGVSEDGIRFLLGHSKYELGNLQYYILSDLKYLKEIRAAQNILEMLFETLMDLETKFNICVNLESIAMELPLAYENQKRNPHYIYDFQHSIINYAMVQMQQGLQLHKPIQPNEGNVFIAPALNTSPSIIGQSVGLQIGSPATVHNIGYYQPQQINHLNSPYYNMGYSPNMQQPPAGANPMFIAR